MIVVLGDVGRMQACTMPRIELRWFTRADIPSGLNIGAEQRETKRTQPIKAGNDTVWSAKELRGAAGMC
jgi:hypothetical protein